MASSFPRAPWKTRGRAFFQPFVVHAGSLRLPEGFAPVAITGRCMGLLGYVEYVAPSPILYRELLWMPALVSVAVEGGRRARGYWVEKMYVDSEASRDGGREIWALPKQLARFEESDGTLRVDTEDGAHLVLDLALRGPALGGPPNIATLQADGDEVVRFRGSGRASLRSARVVVREERGTEGWAGWSSATRVPALGAALVDFDVTMQEPRRMRRA
jgi:hypothetical protein